MQIMSIGKSNQQRLINTEEELGFDTQRMVKDSLLHSTGGQGLFDMSNTNSIAPNFDMHYVDVSTSKEAGHAERANRTGGGSASTIAKLGG